MSGFGSWADYTIVVDGGLRLRMADDRDTPGYRALQPGIGFG
jgi:hypothetical protein